MSKKSKSAYFRIVGEKLFHNAEKERLKTMHEYGGKRDNEVHDDFLSLARNNADTGHQIASEYHGAKFWRHYYEGEPPYPVLRGDPLPVHEYGTGDDSESNFAVMLNPDNTSYELDTMGVPTLDCGLQIASRRHWMDHMCLADTAIRCGEFKQAEYHLLQARAEAARWGAGNERLQATERCLESVRASLKTPPS